LKGISELWGLEKSLKREDQGEHGKKLKGFKKFKEKGGVR